MQRQTLARTPRAVSVANAVVSVAAEMSAAMSRRASHLQNNAKNHAANVRTSAMQHQPRKPLAWTQPRQAKLWPKEISPTSNARPANAVAATVMVVNAVSVAIVLNVLKTALKHLLLLRIQYQMRLQPNKYGRKQLLNL